MLFISVGGLLALSEFRDNLVFFYSPTDLQNQVIAADKLIRVGGLVKSGTIQRGDGDLIHFVITDGASDIKISYNGIPPNLFREGQGCIAEGKISAAGEMIAQKILAKHDEKYMPKEVVDALKRSGNWRGGDIK